MASNTSKTAKAGAAAPAKDTSGQAASVETPPAAVQQQQYAPGTGWEVGQAAPEDRYIEVGPDGADVGSPSKTAPKGKYARQISVKGAPVTDAQRDALGLNK